MWSVPYCPLADRNTFEIWRQALRQQDWVVYAKRPFAGPEAVLAYLSRYTHRVAIANSRLINHDARGVTFKWKDYRLKGRHRYKTMTLDTDEFIRRFLIHVLPKGFHRIRHYGLFANTVRKDNLSKARALLDVDHDKVDATNEVANDPDDTGREPVPHSTFICPSCHAPMMVIEVFTRDHAPRAPPACCDT